MKINIYYFFLIVVISSCSNSKLYYIIREQQKIGLNNLFNYRNGDEKYSNYRNLRLDKARLKNSLKKVIFYIEKNYPNLNNFLLLEINSFPGALYQGMIFDLDKSKGIKFKFVNGKVLFETEKIDSEYRDYYSYIEQFMRFNFNEFHHMSIVHSPDDLFIPYSFITKVNLQEKIVESYAFQTTFWRINSDFNGISIFEPRVID